MCDSELMTQQQQQPNDDNNDNAGDASGSETDEDPEDVDTTDDTTNDNASPAVAIRPADLDALCTQMSLETSEGRPPVLFLTISLGGRWQHLLG